MYELDQEYDEYPKVAAEIISKDPGNWYDIFVINKGSKDGIQKDMNVIADRGRNCDGSGKPLGYRSLYHR